MCRSESTVVYLQHLPYDMWYHADVHMAVGQKLNPLVGLGSGGALGIDVGNFSINVWGQHAAAAPECRVHPRRNR